MAKKGLNITKRKDGRWEARVLYGYDEERGRAKYRYLYGKTYAEAKAKKEVAQSELLYNMPFIPRNRITVDEIFHRFCLHKQVTVKASTLAHYRQLYNTYLCERFGHMRLAEISSNLLEHLAYNLLQSGRCNGDGLSAKTVRDILTLFRSLLRYAVSQKYMSADVLNFTMPRQNTKKAVTLDQREQSILEAFALEDGDSYKFGVMLSLYTGLRIGELCALRWSDIDLMHNEIHVNRTIGRICTGSSRGTQIIITEPKTETSKRTIPLPSFLAARLTEQKALATGETAYVLTGTEKYIEPSNYYMKYTRWLRRLQLSHHSFHTLRHTFATRCIACGFDAKALSEILGHADVKITLNRYVHPSQELKRQYMASLEPICAQSGYTEEKDHYNSCY